jgi:heptosyltransferase-3
VNAPRGRILVIRGGAIGDFILTLPALTALRNQFPQAQLEVLGYPHIVQLAQAGGLVDRVQSIEARALAGFFARDGSLAEDLVAYFSGFDIIVSYLFDPDLIFQTNVQLCSRAQFIAGPHRPDETENIHATKVYLKPLERLAIFDADPVPQLALHASCITHHVLAVHPGSGSEKKNWPEEKWAELLRHLIHSTQLNLLLVGGEAEGEKLQRLTATLQAQLGGGTALSSPSPPPKEPRAKPRRKINYPRAGKRRPMRSNSNPLTPTVSPPGRGEGVGPASAGGTVWSAGRIRVAQSLPLAALAGELQHCTAFVGHDSGISHLAAALGLPGLILWGDTIEEIWRPPHQAVSILKHPGGLNKVSVEQVIRELERLLGE